MNTPSSLFAVAVANDDGPPALPKDARFHTLPPRDGMPIGLEIAGGHAGSVRCAYDAAVGRAVYLWGPAVHRSIADDSALLAWCGREASQDRPIGFRDLLNHWVLLIDDRGTGEVTVVSDFLGLRPWLGGAQNGRLVAGSDAWSLHAAGLTGGAVSYDAVAAWLIYNYDCTGGSLFGDLRRPHAGSVETFARDGTLLRRRVYAEYAVADAAPPVEQVAEELHETVSEAFGVVTRGTAEITLPLSGGFDSRLLLALATRAPGLRVRAVHVQSSPAETAAARRVAEALGVELELVEMGGHTLDLFDEPFPFTAGGFPAGANIATVPARMYPGVPIVSGFLGDPLMRGSADRVAGKVEADYPGDMDAMAAVLRDRHAAVVNKLGDLDAALVARTRERALAPMRRAAEAAPARDRTFIYTTLARRQRYYIANLFLQHAHDAEAVLPFATWGLAQYKMAHARSCFSMETYGAIFARFYPELADVAHNKNLATDHPPPPARPTRHLRRWSLALLGALATGGLPMVRRKRLVSRLAAGLRNDVSRQEEVTFLYKLWLFEQRLRERGVGFDWRAL